MSDSPVTPTLHHRRISVQFMTNRAGRAMEMERERMKAERNMVWGGVVGSRGHLGHAVVTRMCSEMFAVNFELQAGV